MNVMIYRAIRIELSIFDNHTYDFELFLTVSVRFGVGTKLKKKKLDDRSIPDRKSP